MARVVGGWMSNSTSRRNHTDLPTKVRRDSSNTLVYSDVEKYLGIIRDARHWASESEPQLDGVLRMRDSAMLAAAWLFIGRRNELVSIKLGDLLFTADSLEAKLQVEKKKRNIKVCPQCGTKNAAKAHNQNPAVPFQITAHCSVCGSDISAVPLTPVPGRLAQKHITVSLKEPLTAYIATWTDYLWKHGARDESWLFPRVAPNMLSLWLDQHISGDVFWLLCKRLDPSLTCHTWRYGHTEALLRMRDKNGLPMFSHSEICELVGWSSTAMVDLYSLRSGLTVSGAKYSSIVGNG